MSEQPAVVPPSSSGYAAVTVPLDLAQTSAPILPVAEPGDTTSEYKILRIFCLADEAALTLGVAAAAGGVIHPDASLMVFAGIAVQTINAFAISAYGISRGVRKQGTTA